MLAWDAAREQRAETVAHDALSLTAQSGSVDVRIWVAASMQAALRDPALFRQADLDASLTRAVITQRSVSVRSSDQLREGSVAGAVPGGLVDEFARVDSDQVAGLALAELVTSRKRPG